MHSTSHRSSSEEGVVLILVVFVIALASILVVNLAHSTSMGAQLSANIQRSVTAEYLAKSAVNFARVLLRDDKTDEDSLKDPWGAFATGVRVPPELLGLRDQNVRIELEIRPEDSKLPLTALIPPGFTTPDQKWRDAFIALFRAPGLDFDNDKEVDHTGTFKDKEIPAEMLAGILIDYMDPDKVSYVPGGVESDLPDGVFPNQPIRRTSELSAVPGFSPRRLQKLLPFISAVGIPSSGGPGGGTNRVNLNFAPKIVLKSLSPNLDDNMVDAMVEFRASEEGPFTPQNLTSRLLDITGDQQLVTYLGPMVTTESKWFQVIAKVDYGTSLMFMRAYLLKGQKGENPEVRSLEIF